MNKEDYEVMIKSIKQLMKEMYDTKEKYFEKCLLIKEYEKKKQESGE